MTLDSTAKVQNLKASIEKYIHTNIVVTEGITVNYEGKDFESDQLQEWITEALLIPAPVFSGRTVDFGEKGQLSDPIINFNIFVRKNKSTKKTNRHYELRDILFKYFYPGIDIDLYNFESGNFSSSLQKMRIREIITDTPLPDEPNFFNYNFSVSVQWLQKWS